MDDSSAKIKFIRKQIQVLYDEEKLINQNLVNIKHRIYKLALEYWKESYDLCVGTIVYVDGVPGRVVSILSDNRVDNSAVKPTVTLQLQRRDGSYVDRYATISGSGPLSYKLESEVMQEGECECVTTVASQKEESSGTTNID